MLSKHTLNETLKRLEPIDTKCMYCKDGHSTDANDNNYVALYTEEDRTNIIVYRSVKFKKLLVGVPRCRRCLAAHRWANGVAQMYSWGIGIVSFIICIFTLSFYAIFAIFPCLLFALLAPMFITKYLLKGKGVIPKIDGAKKDETIQEFVIRGWSLDPPRA